MRTKTVLWVGSPCFESHFIGGKATFTSKEGLIETLTPECFDKAIRCDALSNITPKGVGTGKGKNPYWVCNGGNYSEPRVSLDEIIQALNELTQGWVQGVDYQIVNSSRPSSRTAKSVPASANAGINFIANATVKTPTVASATVPTVASPQCGMSLELKGQIKHRNTDALSNFKKVVTNFLKNLGVSDEEAFEKTSNCLNGRWFQASLAVCQYKADRFEYVMTQALAALENSQCCEINKVWAQPSLYKTSDELKKAFELLEARYLSDGGLSIDKVENKHLVFAYGNGGQGKTYDAIAWAEANGYEYSLISISEETTVSSLFERVNFVNGSPVYEPTEFTKAFISDEKKVIIVDDCAAMSAELSAQLKGVITAKAGMTIPTTHLGNIKIGEDVILWFTWNMYDSLGGMHCLDRELVNRAFMMLPYPSSDHRSDDIADDMIQRAKK